MVLQARKPYLIQLHDTKELNHIFDEGSKSENVLITVSYMSIIRQSKTKTAQKIKRMPRCSTWS